MVWRIELKPNDVAQLFDEERIDGKLEASAAVRLHAKERHVTLHGALGDAGLTGEFTHTSMCRALWSVLQGGTQRRRNVILTC